MSNLNHKSYMFGNTVASVLAGVTGSLPNGGSDEDLAMLKGALRLPESANFEDIKDEFNGRNKAWIESRKGLCNRYCDLCTWLCDFRFDAHALAADALYTVRVAGEHTAHICQSCYAQLKNGG